MAEEKRRYGGRSREDRMAERREKLLRAALSLYARAGREGASVTAICAEAGLTTRYFYESFPSHDALLLALFRGVCGHLVEDLRATREAGGDVLAAFFSALAQHAALARLFLADFERQDAGVRAAARDLGADLTALLAPDAADPLTGAGALGALFRITRLWVEGGHAEPVEHVVTIARRFIRAAG
ncbi:MAG: TetR/AcrR family transcriptional regulator [Sphingobium sp.]